MSYRHDNSQNHGASDLAADYQQYYLAVLEMLVDDCPLEETLAHLIKLIESEHPDIIASILLLSEDGQHLVNGISSKLPPFYVEAVNGTPIGPDVGCCGTAAFTGERVVVEDIDNHPYWLSYRALAKQAGLAACWSQPIKSADNKVLGTFALYYPYPYAPSSADITRITDAAKLAQMVIERQQQKIHQKKQHLTT